VNPAQKPNEDMHCKAGIADVPESIAASSIKTPVDHVQDQSRTEGQNAATIGSP
jgi:hypothetical protein